MLMRQWGFLCKCITDWALNCLTRPSQLPKPLLYAVGELTIAGGRMQSLVLEMPLFFSPKPPFEGFMQVYYGSQPLYVHIFMCSLP